MKDTMNKNNFASRNTLLRKWKLYSYLVEQEQDDATIEKENALLIEIEDSLPFASEEEHERWTFLGNGNCWEDWEEMTLELINNSQVPMNIDKLLDAYYQVAKDVCEDANFYDLFETFAKLSHHWVDTIDGWNDWWKKISKEEDDAQFFLDTYKDIYGKEYKRQDIYNFYGFETSTHPMFYKNDDESKSDLVDCIFERYVEGLDDDEKLWFYQRLIKELI